NGDLDGRDPAGFSLGDARPVATVDKRRRQMPPEIQHPAARQLLHQRRQPWPTALQAGGRGKGGKQRFRAHGGRNFGGNLENPERRVLYPAAIPETPMTEALREDIETRRKRLLHRSRYTGMKETDILLGGFAAQHLPTFSEREL